MTNEQKIIATKLGLLRLVEQLGHIRQATIHAHRQLRILCQRWCHGLLCHRLRQWFGCGASYGHPPPCQA